MEMGGLHVVNTVGSRNPIWDVWYDMGIKLRN